MRIMELAQRFCEIQANIKIKTNEMKQLKQEQENITETLKKHMIDNDIDKIKVSDTKVIHLKEKKTFSALNKDYILETLKSFYKQPVPKQNQPDQLAELTTDILIENRNVKIEHVIKVLVK